MNLILRPHTNVADPVWSVIILTFLAVALSLGYIIYIFREAFEELKIMERTYLIIPTSELSKVDFSQVCETSSDTVRKSVDETKTFIKWDTSEPSFVDSIEGTEGPYTYEEILTILTTDDWVSSEEY